MLRALEFTSHGPLTCLYPVWQTDMHNDLPGETNDWDSWLGQSAVTRASDKSCVNKLFWNVMVGITRSKVIGGFLRSGYPQSSSHIGFSINYKPSTWGTGSHHIARWSPLNCQSPPGCPVLKRGTQQTCHTARSRHCWRCMGQQQTAGGHETSRHLA